MLSTFFQIQFQKKSVGRYAGCIIQAIVGFPFGNQAFYFSCLVKKKRYTYIPQKWDNLSLST